MATYHLSLKNGKVGTAEQHADYILREGRFAGGKRAEELVYKNANLPRWAMSAPAFFANADKYERANGRAYREFEIALPNELSHEENKKLVAAFIEEHIGNNKVWAYAIHSKAAMFDEGQEQIHAHIMFCERIVTDGMDKAKSPSKFFKRYNSKDPAKGGYQKDRKLSGGRGEISENLKNIRQSWENMVNQKYKEHGINAAVSCKTLKAQRDMASEAGDEDLVEFFDREPQEHLGPSLAYRTKRIIEQNGFDQEHIDNTLDELLKMDETAFKVIMDKITKAHKAAVLRAKRQVELERKEKEYAAKRLEEITVSGEIIRKDFIELLRSVNIQIKYNQSAIIGIEKAILTPEQMHKKALSVMTSGRFDKLTEQKEAIVYLRNWLKEKTVKYKTKENLPDDIRGEYKEKLKAYKILQTDFEKKEAEITAYVNSEYGLKWYNRLMREFRTQKDEFDKKKNELLNLNRECIELRQQVIDVGKQFNPRLHYKMKSKYQAPSFVRGPNAISDSKAEIDKLLRNIISAGNSEHLKNNRMTIDLRERKNNSWEL